MVFDALREGGMGVLVGGCLKQSMVSRIERKREKVRVGPRLRECEAGYRQTIVGSCALDGEGYCIRRGRAEHGCAKVGVANRTWPIQDRERDGESKIKRV